MLKGEESIAIKVQYAAEAKKEYDFTKLLKDHEGFIHYKCHFTCNANKEYFDNNKLHYATDMPVCTSKGTKMGVIVVPMYKLGSFEALLKSKTVENKPKYIRVTDV